MSTKSKYKKSKKKSINYFKLLRSLLIIGVIIFFTGKLIIASLLAGDKTYRPKYDQLNLNEVYQSVIFRKEIMVHTKSSGPVKYFVNEGDKVKKGLKIASVTHEDSNTEEVVQSDDTPNIQEYQQMIQVDIDALDEEIKSKVDQINVNIEEKNYILVSQFKDELLLLLDKKKTLLSNKKLIDKGDSSFKETYVGGGNTAVGAEVSFLSPEPGIVTFNTDGLESSLTIDNIYNINYDVVLQSGANVTSLTSSRITAGNTVYKIVDNSAWFLVSIIDSKDLNLYEKNKKIDVEIDGQRMEASIVDIYPTGEKGALVMKITEQYADFYRKRFVEAHVIRDNYQGLKIMNSSIVDKSGVLGVYVLGLDNKAVFMPISILGKDDEYSIVKDGYIYLEVDGEQVRKKTVDLTDVIIKNGSEYKDGDKVN